jgi:hypothetical protein
MEAPVTGSGVEPYTLDSLIRTVDPPRVTLTTCRTDWLANPSRDQLSGPCPKSGGDAAIIEAVHAPVQRLSRRCVSALASDVGRTTDATMPATATDDTSTAFAGHHQRRLATPKRYQPMGNLLNQFCADDCRLCLLGDYLLARCLAVMWLIAIIFWSVPG